MTTSLPELRIGIDLGGTKIAAVGLDRQDHEIAAARIPAPRGDYGATIEAIAGLVAAIEQQAGTKGSIGVGMPGSISPRTGLVQNSNSTWLNARPFDRDLQARLGRPAVFANDANCFALSEATDGAGQGAASLFGVILGTGCGGGIVINGRIVDGPRGIGGEWGHNPLPWARPDEHPGARCWCGRLGCLETWISGTALAADHARATGVTATGEEIVGAANMGDAAARRSLDRHASRLARGLAHIVNIIDPEVIVLGGGLSGLPHLYTDVPALMAPYVFADAPEVRIVPPRWGDASGVRGAARLRAATL